MFFNLQFLLIRPGGGLERLRNYQHHNGTGLSEVISVSWNLYATIIVLARNFFSFRANGVQLNQLPDLLEKDRLLLKKKGVIGRDTANVAKLTGPLLRKNQIYAIFVKNGLYYLRHYYVTATNLLTPVIFLLMTLISVSIIKERVMDRALMMSLTKVDLNTLTLIYSDIPQRPFTFSFEELVNRLTPCHQATFIDREMGSYLFEFSQKNLFFYTRHMPIGLSLDANETATIWFNGQFLHSMPIGLQMAYDTYLKERNLKLFVYNNPIPIPANEVGGPKELFIKRSLQLLIESLPGIHLSTSDCSDCIDSFCIWAAGDPPVWNAHWQVYYRAKEWL